MKNKLVCIFILLFFIILSSFAQDRTTSNTNPGSATQATTTVRPPVNTITMPSIDTGRILMLARSSSDYRVTPGDVYTLSYAAGTSQVNYVITVDSSYRIRVSNLGVINGAGRTFINLKTEVENIISNNYPLSGVQLVLTQPAIFRVSINGEVNLAGDIDAWGLSRLSSLIVTNLTDFASIRDVSIRASNGQTRVYDLFKAQRLGDQTQDPYLRPGDTITFNKAKRIVTIEGEVKRPGIYQLLDGENINELIDFYGNGYTAFADSAKIEIVRYINTRGISGDKIFLNEIDFINNYPLEHFDSVYVPEILLLQPVMFVEGAVGRTAASSASSSSRIIMRFNDGETYSSLVRRNESWFSEVSDIKNAYIIRKNERIPIDLNLILYDAFYSGNVLVQENDTLIIPFRQYFVSVAGAVLSPGRYPYIPDRDWEYYIGLAGGFVPSRNAANRIEIVDMNGKRLNKTDIITPETTITAITNHFLYYFNQYGPVVTTFLSLITSFFSIITFINSR
ncbi:MAG: SLBB domain-containing protein [Treponema sp.]|nr:SLBB domain-containing protein [Treponema sp.]